MQNNYNDDKYTVRKKIQLRVKGKGIVESGR